MPVLQLNIYKNSTLVRKPAKKAILHIMKIQVSKNMRQSCLFYKFFFINIITEFLYMNFIHQVAAHYYCNNNRVTSLENRGRAELTEAYY